jgi:hypothetical protein
VARDGVHGSRRDLERKRYGQYVRTLDKRGPVYFFAVIVVVANIARRGKQVHPYGGAAKTLNLQNVGAALTSDNTDTVDSTNAVFPCSSSSAVI